MGTDVATSDVRVMTEQPVEPLAFGNSFAVDTQFYDDGVPGYTMSGAGWVRIAPVGNDCALIAWSSYISSEGLVCAAVRWLPDGIVEIGARTVFGARALDSTSGLAGIESVNQAVVFTDTGLHRLAVDTSTLTVTSAGETSTGVEARSGSTAVEVDADRCVFWGGIGSSTTGTRFLVVVDGSGHQVNSVPPTSGGPITADATQIVRTSWSAGTVWRHPLSGLSLGVAENTATIGAFQTDHTVGLVTPQDAVVAVPQSGTTEHLHHYDPTTGALTGPVDLLVDTAAAPVGWETAPAPEFDGVLLRYRTDLAFHATLVTADTVLTYPIGSVQAQSVSENGRRFVRVGSGRYLHLETPLNENSGADVVRRQGWVRPSLLWQPPPQPELPITGAQIGSRRRFTPGS